MAWSAAQLCGADDQVHNVLSHANIYRGHLYVTVTPMFFTGPRGIWSAHWTGGRLSWHEVLETWVKHLGQDSWSRAVTARAWQASPCVGGWEWHLLFS